ncbi:hypothetical protein K474DRAFT_1674445 [Panus rudis PR-1116 ss-1]|nr:hypothetical protein K474DRAFT_1674445 [Panus rudis PR-1116 ss-1]
MQSTTSTKGVVPGNAFHTVILSGIARAKDAPQNTAFQRFTASPNKPRADIIEDSSSPELAGMVIPPLVVKMSNHLKSRELIREAFYYEELEPLEGSVIPRYYGLFQAIIPTSWKLPPWDPASLPTPIHNPPPDYYEEDDYTSESSDDDDYDEAYNDVRPENEVTILILERLGDRMLPGPITGQEHLLDIEKELHALFHELVDYAVEHYEVHWTNVLKINPETSPDLPQLPSPRGETYQYRIIDFNKACKTNIGAFANAGYWHHIAKKIMKPACCGYTVGTESTFKKWVIH